MLDPRHADALGRGTEGGRMNQMGGGSVSILPDPADGRIAARRLPSSFTSSTLIRAGGDLTGIHPEALAVFTDGYSSGYVAGLEAGRAQYEAEDAAWWASVARSMHALAKQPTYAELQRRRAWGGDGR